MKRTQFINRKLYFVLFILSLLLCSCTDSFDKMNTHPYWEPYVSEDNGSELFGDINLSDKTTEKELATLRNGKDGIGQIFKKFTYEGLVADYQRATNLTHDVYAGYFATNNPAFLNASPNYIYSNEWSSRRWDYFYKSRSAEYKVLARTFWYVDRNAYKNAFYISRIYYAFLASTMTDTYGDIPFKAYIKGEETSEKISYDSQKDVYDMIFRILKQATENIEPGKCSFKFKENEDKCFKGDEEKWVRFANTLRLRLALRISNVDPIRAKQEGQEAMAHPAGLMKSQADRMATIPDYAPVDMGGENDGGKENEVVNCSYRYLDAVMSKDIELAYKNQSNVLDPRCPISWFRPTLKEELESGYESRRKDFTGCEIGSSDISRNSNQYSVLRCNAWEDKSVLRDDYWFGYSREYLWFGYAESRFLLAEASLRGWAGASKTPKQYFEEGIRASMDYYHISPSAADEYIKGLKILTSNDPFESNDREVILEQIITQKWLAIFPNGNEGWAEFRRTDYPRLRNHLNNRDADIPKNDFIKRVSYPNDEIEYNASNLPKNVNQGTRVWWDVANTNQISGERNKPNNFR